MLIKAEFEVAWGKLLDKYKLRAHLYMTQLYEIRKKWLRLTSKEYSVRR
jgi:hypothetical protein